MTEVLFYHLQDMTLENVLPPLLEKSLERGWRVVVQSTSPERADALDAHLWTYRDDSFLPHATWRAGDAQDQPIVLAVEEGNPNRANVRFLVDSAPLPADSDAYDRVVLVFNGDDGEALAAARSAWTDCRTRGSRSPTGRPTNGAGGSGGNSDIRQLMIICGFGRRACK
jgi:DNA polymerase-3 subunit chi